MSRRTIIPLYDVDLKKNNNNKESCSKRTALWINVVEYQALKHNYSTTQKSASAVDVF